ncbi:MAG TPA: aminopeptidase N, partial [Dehalococcoidia bacterium]|nr:aminopeptidase N [Dehalococcoidia bacterium]
FHQFIDPADGAEYLYTNFEPYDSHRLFPQFDQPDIKASYNVTVAGPADWEVVANSREAGCEKLPDGRERRTYAGTERFSTYLFAIVAGPYHVFRAEHEGIPLGIYTRKSLVEHVDDEEIFTITKQGLTFFADFFDYPYPFDKYDQCFVPEFNAGAMENVGCITHNELMIHREPPTDNQRRRRAEIILHEMAHMWFGDLVTMRWWNDLWLNESFATYMAYLAIDRATRFDTGWLDFNASEKAWGYRQDQLVTTHPIAGQVEDTDQTTQNFDGITYAKGASVIKQLVASIGPDGFRKGMRYYFREHEWGNTTLSQFLAALEVGSGRPLEEWSKLWLETASLNTLAASWETDGERISSLGLTQTAPDDYPTLRPHFVEVGILSQGAGNTLRVESVPARIEGPAAAVQAAEGLPVPLLVFPNYNDHGWLKVALDESSLDFVRQRIDSVEDTLLRQMLWSSLYTMVRDAQLKSTDYLDFVRSKIVLEPNVSMTDAVLLQAQTTLGRFVPDELKDDESHFLFAAARAALEHVPRGDLQIIWARNLIAFAANSRDLGFCADLADGKESIEGLTIDQDMRWSIATRFTGLGLEGAEQRVQTEIERDKSDRGSRNAITAAVSKPAPEGKQQAWDRIHGEGYGSLQLTNAALAGFNWWRQREIIEPFAKRFFEAAPDVFRNRDNEFTRGYGVQMFPSYIAEEWVIERSEQLMKEIGDSVPMLRRTLMESNDELGRAIRCRELASS